MKIFSYREKALKMLFPSVLPMPGGDVEAPRLPRDGQPDNSLCSAGIHPQQIHTGPEKHLCVDKVFPLPQRCAEDVFNHSSLQVQKIDDHIT